MIVEKEKIDKAKAKLGDLNAVYIAEALGIENFDVSSGKTLCPFHNEDTPSFIYHTRSYSFHCYGCNRNVDIIDAFMQQGTTFIDAVKRLFKIAEVPYNFGEQGVQTKRSHIYPKEVICSDKSQVYKYWEQRGISRGTIDRLDVRQDNDGNTVFNYYDVNDVLTNVKYRPSRKIVKGENKCWFQPGATVAPLLFNMNKVNTNAPLLICEGEGDCLSACESGYPNAVSVPTGAGNFKWIEENFDWLEQFEEIIIAADNDEPGIKMQKEVSSRLGSWRTKVVEIPQFFYDESKDKKYRIKDLNEVLYFFGKEKLLEIILNAKDSPVPSLVDFSDIQEVDVSDIDGVYTGIEILDKELMRLFFGSFNIISGTPGSGKTSFLYQLLCNCMDQGRNCWTYSKELPGWMSRNWLNSILAGPRHVSETQNDHKANYWRADKESVKAISEFYRDRLKFYKDDYPNDIESIQTSMIDAARKYGSKLFIIDNMTTIDLGANDENKWEKQTGFVNWLIQFAMKYNVCVILVVHPRKFQANDAYEVGMYDISGSANIINLAHRAISLKRVSDKEKHGVPNRRGEGWEIEPFPYDVKVSVLKDRFRGRSGMEFGLHYDIPSRRFFTNQQEYEHQYKWDKGSYPTPLAYPLNNSVEGPF